MSRSQSQSRNSSRTNNARYDPREKLINDLKGENDTLKLQLNRLDLEIKLLKDGFYKLKEFVHANIKQDVKSVKSVENYTLKLKNKKIAEERIYLEKWIDRMINTYHRAAEDYLEYLENPNLKKFKGKKIEMGSIISGLISERERTVEEGFTELTEKIDEILLKIDPEGLGGEPEQVGWND